MADSEVYSRTKDEELANPCAALFLHPDDGDTSYGIGCDCGLR